MSWQCRLPGGIEPRSLDIFRRAPRPIERFLPVTLSVVESSRYLFSIGEGDHRVKHFRLGYLTAAGSSLLLFFAVALARAGEAPFTAVATLDGESIFYDELEKLIGGRVATLNDQIYQLQRQTVDQLINERLFAKEAVRRGFSAEGLIGAEISAKTEAVTEAEVETFYHANESRLPTQEPDLRERIRAYLLGQKTNARREAFLGELRAKADVKVLLKRPAIFRVALNIAGAPFKGPAAAPVTVVKFEDFHCPFCKEAQRTIAQLLERYPDRVKLVHKDYPIDELHPGARAGHLAARCATEQGKFWPYHDALYTNAPKGAPEELRSYAKTAGLDVASFDQCVSAERYAAQVQKDIDEAKQAGVSGTPAFFINGRLLVGAQPLENFVALIEEELSLAR
jgi:protein-disulfide isomerase